MYYGHFDSGETDEIIDLIPFLKRFNVSVVSMTGNLTRPLRGPRRKH